MTNWINALLGGMLIGVSATLLLAGNGQIAGISGIFNNSIRNSTDRLWSCLFLAGLLGGGAIYHYVLYPVATPHPEFIPWTMLISGFLVGVGTRMANGCTSGHGVCGLGRLSRRSLAAVLTFLSTAMLTVFIIRHLF